MEVGMRVLLAVALTLVVAAACGGGSSSPPIQVSPAVTSAPEGSAMPKATPGYDYGY